MDQIDVRVRFAPSPTGLLHIGGLRTALYNYLFARKVGGTFVVRIEDTDRQRYVAEAEQDMLDSLAWASLDYDEGPKVGGDYGPYYQSHRKAHYRHYVDLLLAEGHAYYAFDSKEELDEMRSRLATPENPSPKYDALARQSMKNSFTMDQAAVQAAIEKGNPYVVRLRVPDDEQIQFDDLVRGTVSFASAQVDDQILLKSDGMPTYHLANVVDDHLMGITHIIRGEEWLPSTPKHMLLYKAFGWEPPQTAHLPLILSPTGGKLSKRNAEKMGIPVSVRQYQEAGYEPEAVVNFLAMLGWNPGTEQELFTVEELVAAFSADRIGSSGVQFNLDKLKWYNEQYLRGFSLEELQHRVRPSLAAADIEVDNDALAAILGLMQERMSFASDLVTEVRYFFDDPSSYNEKALKKRWKEDTPALLQAYMARIESADFTAEALETNLKAVAEEHEAGLGKLMAPLRIALSGVAGGPSLYDMMVILGKETCMRRLQKALDTL
ncbi:MAG: glutamate--tRNA ligase [Bacteroidota bacterium]